MPESGPSRRLRFVRALEPVALPSPRERETAASILPGVPRVAALDALLREVDDLRLTLETDLTLAAAAVEAGGSDTASEIIEADLESLHAFETSAMGHLADLAAGSERTEIAESRWSAWARAASAPFVAAAAVIGLLIGVGPQLGGASPSTHEVSSVSAQSSLAELTTLAAQGRTSEVRVAALTLHDQITALVDQSSSPATAQQALLLLSYERNVIVQSGDSAALHDVLVQSAALAAKIRSALPSSLRTNVPLAPAVTPLVQASPTRQTTRTRATASPTPSPKPTTSPKPSPTASKAPASATPSPTASPSSSSSSDPTMPFLPAGSTGGSDPAPPPGGSH